jgi:hypothetical protein
VDDSFAGLYAEELVLLVSAVNASGRRRALVLHPQYLDASAELLHQAKFHHVLLHLTDELRLCGEVF